MSPFMGIYGYHHPSITSPLRGKVRVQVVEEHIEHQQEVLKLLEENLVTMQNRMEQVDQHCSEMDFEVEVSVFLMSQPYNKCTLSKQCPYEVLQRIGSMDYKLDFPLSSHVHPMFHISFLKKTIGDKIPIQTILPDIKTRIKQLQN
jgi:hypothetical protein